MGESDLYSGILLPKIIGLFPSLMRVCVMQAWRPEETGGGHTHTEKTGRTGLQNMKSTGQ